MLLSRRARVLLTVVEVLLSGVTDHSRGANAGFDRTMPTRSGFAYNAFVRDNRYAAECVICLAERDEWKVRVYGCRCRAVCKACFDDPVCRASLSRRFRPTRTLMPEGDVI